MTLQPGDVLAMRGTGFWPSLVRLATLSDWHHVGMVVPTPSGLQVLEADPKRGVCLTPLADLLPAYHLPCGRMWTPEAQAVVDRTLGLPYSRADGLLTFLRLRPVAYGKQCAELTRELLQALGAQIPDDANTPTAIVTALMRRGCPLIYLA